VVVPVFVYMKKEAGNKQMLWSGAIYTYAGLFLMN
jgi:hypothetical protein